MKKRILSLFTASAMVLTLASCTGNSNQFAEFTIERVDASYYDEAGIQQLEQYYDKVVIEPDNEKYENINSLIQKDCDAFLADAEKYKEERIEDLKSDYPAIGHVHCVSSEVTRDGGGILSIKATSSFFFGGTVLTNYKGLNYDLTTGEVLQLTKVFSISEDEMEEYFKEESKKYIDENLPQFEDSKETVEAYTLDDFDYYIEGDNVCLCFPTHRLADGATGPVVVPCPIK